MTFVVVPQEVGTTSATVWVGATDEGDVRALPVQLDLGDGAAPVELPGKGWKMWETFREEDPAGYAITDNLLHKAFRQERAVVERLHYQRVEIEDLSPRTSYEACLIVDGCPCTGTQARLRSCSFKTLPERLPEQESGEAFTVLLGSCFYGPNDPAGRAGRTVAALPAEHRPDAKFLCGDQVYLDNPW